MPSGRLLVRWSWRDLRHRWLQVAAIALLLAVGIGMYAGLGSAAAWRYASNDASYELLAMHDLRVELGPGNLTPNGSLAAVAAGLAEVTAAEERLVLPTQVRVVGDEEVLARGQIMGVPADGAQVNRVHVYEGRGLQPTDDGHPVVLLERNFALAHDLPSEGRLDLGGGRSVDYVGHATSPEHFMVMGEGVELMAQASYAVLFAPLSTVQAATGPVVNDLVVALSPAADVGQARERLATALAAELPDVGATVTTRAEDPVHHILYEDIDNDQRVWNVIAFLILGGATLATFNLASRVIEAQRREIGIGMAVGVPPPTLAVRPLLFGLQIGLLGVAGGLGVGLAVTAGMRGLFESFLPLPLWITELQAGPFAIAALLGVLLPIVATAYPVWRALRVEPVEAIRHVAASQGGLARLAARVPLPGGTVAQVPVRNLLRNPRRTVLTALAVGAALTTLVAVAGILDTFDRTVGDYGVELAGDSPERVTATFALPVAVDGGELGGILALSEVAALEPSVRLPATVTADGEELPVLIDLVDTDEGLWTPTIVEGADPQRDGLVLARRAADDLGVAVGDAVVLRHPQRTGEAAFQLVDTAMLVTGIHAGPFRFSAYLDEAAVEHFGLAGAANVAHVLPVPGVDDVALQRALFGAPGVASVAGSGALIASLEDALDLITGVLAGALIAVIALALLIAFNAASISADERAREHATMLAFGMRTRSVLRLLTVESTFLGVLGTVVGIAAGVLVLRWVINTLMPETMPEFAMTVYIAPQSIALVFGVGVLAVALAPLLMVRKLRRMDIPSTLRVLE
jgi:putative ABC transport system permease protein